MVFYSLEGKTKIKCIRELEKYIHEFYIRKKETKKKSHET